jgi:serine/threonine protein kinase
MISTSLSRGTGGYRAPELLKEDPKFCRSVDLWGLGCVLYEIAVGKRAFAGDWAVFHYGTSTSDIPPVVQSGTNFFRHHLNGVLSDLLNRHPEQRPKIPCICSILESYMREFEPSAGSLYDSSVYPSYQEWKKKLNLNENM